MVIFRVVKYRYSNIKLKLKIFLFKETSFNTFKSLLTGVQLIPVRAALLFPINLNWISVFMCKNIVLVCTVHVDIRIDHGDVFTTSWNGRIVFHEVEQYPLVTS